MVLHKNVIVCFIGTYTKNKSEGIYRINFNADTCDIEKFNLAYKIDNPTYMTVDDERNILYSSCKINDQAGVVSFKYWQEQDTLNLINYNVSEKNQPCHVSICRDKQLLLSSNYHENKMIIYNTLEGIILNYPTCVSHNADQKTPHIHCSIFTDDQKYIVSVDLGLDKLIVHELQKDKATYRDDLSFSFPEGTGPRHITSGKSGYYYVLSEYTSEIFVLKYKESKNSIFEEVQRLSSLPKNYDGIKSGAAIRIHPNGRFLYTSERGNNTINLFHISEGKLTYSNSFSCNGDSPRDFNIDPTGKFLFCANEKSNNISIFSINKNSGELNLVSTSKVDNPTAIQFI